MIYPTFFVFRALLSAATPSLFSLKISFRVALFTFNCLEASQSLFRTCLELCIFILTLKPLLSAFNSSRLISYS